MIDNTKEYILCAAVKRKTPRKCCPYSVTGEHNDIVNIEIGYRHGDIYERFGDELSLEPQSQGFYTSKGRFLDRYEGMKVAYNAGQVDEHTALSKDWWNHPLQVYDTEGNLCSGVEYWKTHDTHKFNMLASEDLY